MPLADILGDVLQTGLPLAGGFAGGPPGMVAGGLLGLLGKGITERFRPETAEDRARGQLLSQLQQQYQPGTVSFDPIEQQELRRFQQQIVPGLAERFTGAGAQRSSAFRQQLGGAGADLASRLAALRSQHELGQQQVGMQARGLEQQRMGGLQGFLSQRAAQEAQARQAQMAPMMGLLSAFPQAQLGQKELSLKGMLAKQQQDRNRFLDILTGQKSAQQSKGAHLNQLIKMLQAGGGPQFQPAQRPAQVPWWQDLLSGLAQRI